MPSYLLRSALWAEESYLSQIEVASMLRELNASIETTDTERLRALVKARVDGYHHQAEAPLAVGSATGTEKKDHLQ